VLTLKPTEKLTQKKKARIASIISLYLDLIIGTESSLSHLITALDDVTRIP
jgi:hypothetical protein